MGARLPVAALVGALLVAAGACTYAPRYDDGPYYDRPDRYHDYFYYPGVAVYFHLYSGYYYYRDGPRWVRTRVLPRYIYLDHRLRRPIVVRDAKPYLQHRDHAARFRPRQEYRGDRESDRREREHNRKRFDAYQRGEDLRGRRDARDRRD